MDVIPKGWIDVRKDVPEVHIVIFSSTFQAITVPLLAFRHPERVSAVELHETAPGWREPQVFLPLNRMGR